MQHPIQHPQWKSSNGFIQLNTSDETQNEEIKQRFHTKSQTEYETKHATLKMAQHFPAQNRVDMQH